MTTFTLIRHGQTDWNLEGRYQGQSDIPLNDTGRAQARTLAGRLAAQSATAPFQAIYASDLLRACETAHILASCLNLPVALDARLREIDLGSWEGMLFNDICSQFPAEMALRTQNLRDYRSPGGETAGEVGIRMIAAANDIARLYPHGSVLLVSHGVALATLYCHAQCISSQEVARCIPDNTTPVVIQWHSNGHAGND